MCPIRRVLVVDDEPDFTEVTKMILERFGFEVTIAHDGHAGFEAFRLSNPHVVLTDLKMPHGGGIGLITRIREVDAAIPIIVMSGNRSFDDALAAGASVGFRKPVDPLRVVAEIERLIRRSATG